ncbi:hypothetical protein FGB62_407g011 [Gracilaria domingensis]|nr:hypothetical protein FGB62_407g011 [Gracilaria domingensis]
MLLTGSSHECNWVPEQGVVVRDMELLAADGLADSRKTDNLTAAKHREDGAHSELMSRQMWRMEEAGEVEHQMDTTEAAAGVEELRQTDRKAEAAAHPAGRNTAQDDPQVVRVRLRITPTQLGRSDSDAHSMRSRDQC